MKSYVLEIPNSLSKKSCETIIKKFEEEKSLQYEGIVGPWEEVRKELKASTDICLYFNPQNDKDWQQHELMYALHNGVKKYVEQYPRVDQLAEWEVSEYYNVQKYLPNQGYFQWHCEDSVGNKRLLAWMIYLNTVHDQGGTEFDDDDIPDLNPQQGSLAIWPAYFTHFHRGIPSPTETKYICTGWFEFKG